MTGDEKPGFKVRDRRVSAEPDTEKDDAPQTQAAAPREALSEPPAMDFSTLLLSLSTSALMYLGLGHEKDSPDMTNLPLAKQTIDCIALLEEKTAGNLSGEEERLLSEILYDLRMRYVALTKAKS